MKIVSNNPVAYDLKALMEVMFNAGETIGKLKTSGKSFNQCDINEHWSNIVINPVKDGVCEENITSYRSFLFEIDPDKKFWDKLNEQGRQVELNMQLKYFVESGLPISAVVYSGNKSLHVVVSLEEPLASREEWKRVRQWMRNILSDADRNSSAVVGLRNPLNTREDTGLNPSILQVNSRIPLIDLNNWLATYPSAEPSKNNPSKGSKFDSKELKKNVDLYGKGELRKATVSFFNGKFEEGEWSTKFWCAANDCFGQGYDFDEVIEALRAITGHLDSNDKYQLQRIYQKGEFFEYKRPFRPGFKWV